MSKGVRINEDVCKGISGALFGVAIIAAVARTVIQYRTNPRFGLDDALLLFACICLTAATGLLFVLIPHVYIILKLNLGISVTLPFPIIDFAKETVYTTRVLHAFTLLSWTTLYAVKFSFLFFFRALIDRVQRMIIYWRIVVSITVILGAISVCDTFIGCPHISLSSITCLQGSGFRRTYITDEVANALDILTDILLITIPIGLLWNVRIDPKKKIGISAFLCLSVFMIIIAIIRAAGLKSSVGSFDLVWAIFWAHVESCVAVIMISFTAFRAIFVSDKPRARKNTTQSGILRRIRSWLTSRRGSSGDGRQRYASDEKLPQVTLGSRFWSGRGNGLLASQPQTTSGGSVLEEMTEGSEGLGCRADDSTVSTFVESGSYEQTLDKALQPERLHPGRHWWQMGIVSNISLSRSRPYDSKV